MDYRWLGKETEDTDERTDLADSFDSSDSIDSMDVMDEEAETRALNEMLEIPECTFSSAAGRLDIDRTMRFYKAYSLLKKICVERFDLRRERITPSLPGSGGLIIEADRVVLRQTDIKIFDAVRRLSDSVNIEGSVSGKVRIHFWFN